MQVIGMKMLMKILPSFSFLFWDCVPKFLQFSFSVSAVLTKLSGVKSEKIWKVELLSGADVSTEGIERTKEASLPVRAYADDCPLSVSLEKPCVGKVVDEEVFEEDVGMVPNTLLSPLPPLFSLLLFSLRDPWTWFLDVPDVVFVLPTVLTPLPPSIILLSSSPFIVFI